MVMSRNKEGQREIVSMFLEDRRREGPYKNPWRERAAERER